MAVAIVPAAGRSERMGRPKLLLPAGGGETVVGATIRPLVEGGVERVCVVVGPVVGPGAGPGREDRDAERLRDWALGRGFTVAVNPDPERGMLSSILEGLSALGGAERLAAAGQVLLVTPADLPGLRPSTVRAVLRALRMGAATSTALAVPVVVLGGPPGRHLRRGHPLAIAPRLLREVAELDLDVPHGGLRQILDRHPDEILEVPVDDPGCIHDIDTPEDYSRVVRGSGPDP